MLGEIQLANPVQIIQILLFWLSAPHGSSVNAQAIAPEDQTVGLPSHRAESAQREFPSMIVRDFQTTCFELSDTLDALQSSYV